MPIDPDNPRYTDEARDIEAALDDIEGQLVDDIKTLAREHRDLYKAWIRDREGTEPAEIQNAQERIRQQVLPEYRQAVRQAVESARQAGRSLALKHNPWLKQFQPDAGTQMADSQTAALEINVANIAKEIFQRQDGWLSEQLAEQINAMPADAGTPSRGNLQLDTLQESTLEKMAGKATTKAHQRGRDDAVSPADRNTGKTQIRATRNEVLDDNTCDFCESIDGETFIYGSNQYRRNLPPNGCAGRDRCRGWMEYEEPNEGSADVSYQLAAEDINGPWVQIFQWGQIYHSQGDLEITPEVGRALKYSFDWCARFGERESGDPEAGRPPILSEHKDTGLTYGYVADLQLQDDGVWILPKFRKFILPAVRKGLIARHSPYIVPNTKHQNADKVFDWRLVEWSFVSRQHLQDVPTLQSYSFSDASARESNQETHIMPGLKDAVDDEVNQPETDGDTPEGEVSVDGLLKRNHRLQSKLDEALEKIEKLEAKISELEGDDTDEDDTDEGEDGGTQLSAALSKIEDLRQENAREKVLRELGGTPDDEELVDDLVGLKLKDGSGDSYERMLSLAKDAMDTDDSDGRKFTDSEVGSTGNPPTNDGQLEALEQAREEGIELGADLVKYMDDKGFDDPDMEKVEQAYDL